LFEGKPLPFGNQHQTGGGAASVVGEVADNRVRNLGWGGLAPRPLRLARRIHDVSGEREQVVLRPLLVPADGRTHGEEDAVQTEEILHRLLVGNATVVTDVLEVLRERAADQVDERRENDGVAVVRETVAVEKIVFHCCCSLKGVRCHPTTTVTVCQRVVGSFPPTTPKY
jgi:hypothetical protein